jgi:GH24 family phage-related lysozyme (muramidase)
MEFNDLGLTIIKSFESCVLKSYPDPASGGPPWTIGYGATGAGIGPGVIWTQEQADIRLASDTALQAQAVKNFIERRDLTDDQFSALVSFAYNVKSWRGTPLFALIRAGKYGEAATHFPLYDMADGKVLPGLTTRRKAEQALFNGDTDGVQAILKSREV